MQLNEASCSELYSCEGWTNGLTKSIAFGYGKDGIRCNIINPGGTKTNIHQNSGGAYHPAGQALSKIISSFPVDWYGEPEDIAKTCLFLCSDDAKHINGALLAVDGGMGLLLNSLITR